MGVPIHALTMHCPKSVPNVVFFESLECHTPTLWFQKRDTTGKKMTRLENGLSIGDRASGLGVSIKGMDILLSALKYSEIIQF